MCVTVATLQHEDEEEEVHNLENLWQFSKVWPGALDERGDPTPEFFLARSEGWADYKAHHSTKPANVESNIPLFIYWKGKQTTLSYKALHGAMKACSALLCVCVCVRERERERECDG